MQDISAINADGSEVGVVADQERDDSDGDGGSGRLGHRYHEGCFFEGVRDGIVLGFVFKDCL